MANGYAQLPAYRVDNAMVNFDPLNKGIASVVKGEQQNYERTNAAAFGNAMATGDAQGAMIAGAKIDPKLAMDAGLYPLKKTGLEQENEKTGQEIEKNYRSLIGSHAQTLTAIKDPTERAAALGRWVQSEPRVAKGLEKMGVDWKANPDAAIKSIYQDALGAQDPEAQAKTTAETYKLTQEGRLAGAQADLGSKTTNAQDYNFYSKQEQEAGRAPQTFSDWDLARRRAAATAISIDQKGEAKFNQEVGSHQAKRFDEYVKGGTQAQQMVADLSALRDIGSRINTGKIAEVTAALGPYADALGIKVDGLGELQAYKAIVSRLAPQMRVPGSGATSDFEMHTFLQGLPDYGRTQAGNEMVDKTLSSMQAHRIALSEIGSRAMAHEITPAQAEREVRALPDPFTLWRQYTKQNPTSVSPPAQPGAAPPTTGQPTSMPERGAAPPGQQGQIPPEAVRMLQQNASNPAVLEAFRAKYGVDPSQFLRRR